MGLERSGIKNKKLHPSFYIGSYEMKKIIFLFLIFNFSSPASSVNLDGLKMYVFSESNSESDIKCKFDYSSSIAAVKAALRYNRIQEADRNISNINVYININSFEVTKDECAVAFSIDFQKHGLLSIDGTSNKVIAKKSYCDKNASGYLNKLNIQTMINDRLKQFVDQCVSTIGGL